jgi:hypothetical protein
MEINISNRLRDRNEEVLEERLAEMRECWGEDDETEDFYAETRTLALGMIALELTGINEKLGKLLSKSSPFPRRKTHD